MSNKKKHKPAVDEKGPNFELPAGFKPLVLDKPQGEVSDLAKGNGAVRADTAKELEEYNEAVENGDISYSKPAPEPVRLTAGCGNCAFFVRLAEPHQANGNCRRHAPTALIIDMKQNLQQQNVPIINGYFTPVHETVWCGEWEPKPPPRGELN
jgi:hypothetical protein